MFQSLSKWAFANAYLVILLIVVIGAIAMIASANASIPPNPIPPHEMTTSMTIPAGEAHAGTFRVYQGDVRHVRIWLQFVQVGHYQEPYVFTEIQYANGTTLIHEFDTHTLELWAQ